MDPMIIAVGLSLVAILGGMLTLGLLDLPDGPPNWLRYGHAACGVLALVLVLALAPGGSIRESGLIVGAFGFTAAAGGTLFRQRRRTGTIRTSTAIVHGILGGFSAALLLTIWLLGRA